MFTGELSSITREDAADLVKRYCGRVTGSPSGKTSYVVVGDDAGESKLQKVKALKIKTLDEDQFLELIATSPAKTPEGVIVKDEPEAITSSSASAKKKADSTVAHPIKSENVAAPSNPAPAQSAKPKTSSKVIDDGYVLT